MTAARVPNVYVRYREMNHFVRTTMMRREAADWVSFPPARRKAARHLYLGMLSEIESIFDINTQIPNRALDLRVAEQDLYGA
jgi:hypothetical protein